MRLGGTLPRKVSTGEVVAIGTTDLSSLGQVMDVTARFAGAIVSFVLVSVILLQTSVHARPGRAVGVPAADAADRPAARAAAAPRRHPARADGRPLQHRHRHRQRAAGAARHRRRAGLPRPLPPRVADHPPGRGRGRPLQSVLDALQVFLPGVFVVLVVWLGARYAVAGRISAGELVAFYGYAAFLMIPLRTATEYANKLIRGRVAARRVCRVLALDPDLAEPADPAPSPPAGAALYDARTGLHVAPGLLTAIVSEQPDDSAVLADRLGLRDRHARRRGPARRGAAHLGCGPRRYAAGSWSPTPAPTLFSGRLDDRLDDPRGRRGGDGPRPAHRRAEDVLDALDGGLDGEVAERGRSFSGGQRQRLVLARALLTDPEILVLVEPTSAVDAHTEARIAARLRDHRAGRTTVVTTSAR